MDNDLKKSLNLLNINAIKKQKGNKLSNKPLPKKKMDEIPEEILEEILEVEEIPETGKIKKIWDFFKVFKKG